MSGRGVKAGAAKGRTTRATTGRATRGTTARRPSTTRTARSTARRRPASPSRRPAGTRRGSAGHTGRRSRPPMDQRMRARRAEVLQATRRRRRRRTSSVILLLALGAAALALGRSPLFTIDEVRVDGVDAARADEVRQVMDVEVGQNLFDADLASARARVLSLPWVREASVDQVPPSSVVADVEPRTTAAILEVGDSAWVLDERGVVIDGGRREDAPTLRADGADVPPLGERVTDPGVRAALGVARALPGGFADRVRSYGVDDRGRVVAVLDTGDLLPAQDDLAVVLGSSERIADKARVSTAMLDVLAADQGAAERPEAMVLDVSAPDNPVLRAR